MVTLYPHPYNYFKNGWNILDFIIIVVSLLPLTGGFTTVGRLIRLLRVTRLTNRSKEMSVMVMTINPLNGIFFVSFIIIGTFIVINIFVAII